MHRRILIVLMVLLQMCTLTSCFDSIEIDDQAYVVAMGVDLGVSDKWRLTLKFPTTKGQEGGSSGGESMGESGGNKEGYGSVTVDAPSFYTGIHMIDTMVPRKLNFMHTQYLVFSEELARSGVMGEFIAPILRYREMRGKLNVIVSRDSAMDFVDAITPYIGTSLSKTSELSMRMADRTGFFPDVSLYELNNAIKSIYRQPVAILAGINKGETFKEEGSKWKETFKTGGDYLAGEIPRKGGSPIEFFGCVLSHGDTMVGELDGQETRLMLIARGDFERAFFTIPDPKKPELIVPLDVRQAKDPKVRIRFEKGIPVIDLKVFLKGDLLAVQSRINYEKVEMKPVLEEAFEQHIQSGLNNLIQKCKTLNVDAFRFGATAIRQFKTIPEWEEYNWNEQFEKAQVKVEVQFLLRNTGTMIKSAPIKKTEGEE